MIELVPGARLPERTFGPVTLTDIVRYQGASGDMNPIHHDDEFARSAGFPAAIGVGMLGAGWLAAYCTEHLGEESVRRFRTRFSAVVYRGDRLTASPLRLAVDEATTFCVVEGALITTLGLALFAAASSDSFFLSATHRSCSLICASSSRAVCASSGDLVFSKRFCANFRASPSRLSFTNKCIRLMA